MQSHYACLRELDCGRQIAVVTGDEFHGKTLFHLFLCLTTLLAIKCKTLTKVNINVHDKINDWKYTFQSFTMSCSGKRCHMTSILNFQLTLHFYKYQELFISILSCIADEVEWSSPNGVHTESWWPVLTSLKEKLSKTNKPFFATKYSHSHSLLPDDDVYTEKCYLHLISLLQQPQWPISSLQRFLKRSWALRRLLLRQRQRNSNSSFKKRGTFWIMMALVLMKISKFLNTLVSYIYYQCHYSFVVFSNFYEAKVLLA